MLYKKFGGDNFAAQMVGEAKLRQLKQVDAPYLSASGPGFSARKRGGANEVWIENEDVDTDIPGWQVLTTPVNQNYSIRWFQMDEKLRGVSMPIRESAASRYIGRGLFSAFIIPPQVRLFKHEFIYHDHFVNNHGTKNRIWSYTTKPGYLLINSAKPRRKKLKKDKLLIPVMEGLQKFIGYGLYTYYSSGDFPGFEIYESKYLIETVRLPLPEMTATFHTIDDVERCSIVGLNSKIVGVGGFGIPTAHATLDIGIFDASLSNESIQKREVSLPVGMGGTGQHLCAAQPIIISPGVVCIISCEVYENRLVYDGKIQGDLYLSIYDISESMWITSAAKITPEPVNDLLDDPYLKFYISGRKSDGSLVVNVPEGDLSVKLEDRSYHSGTGFVAQRFISGVEAGTGQSCCSSDNILFSFVRTTIETATSKGYTTRSVDILVMKINRDGVAKITRLEFPYTRESTESAQPSEYSGMHSRTTPQYLKMMCIGKNKLLLQINRYSNAVQYGSEPHTPPAEFFNFIKFMISEDDGDSWHEINPSGLPFKLSSVATAAEIGRPSIINRLTKVKYIEGEYAEIIIPFFHDNIVEYYVSRDGCRSWEPYGKLELEHTDVNNSDTRYSHTGRGLYSGKFTDMSPHLLQGEGFGKPNIYKDYFVREHDIPTEINSEQFEIAEGMTGMKLQRVFIGNDPAPMDLVRPWIYDSAYEKPKEP